MLGFLGILLLLVGCSGESENTTALDPPQPPEVATGSPTFKVPLVNQSPKLGSLPPVPGLLQPTNAKTRTGTIVKGRRDPFAAIPTAVPIVVSSNRSPVKANIAPLPTKAPTTSGRPSIVPLPPLATAPVAALPDLSGGLPPVRIPVAPPSPTALAESIEVSGVVQVGGKWNVIVKEPTASSSRYVAVGEYLENGQVLVKKVVSPASADPIVVLQQDGVEIRKSVV
jgi:hypothetical protein